MLRGMKKAFDKFRQSREQQEFEDLVNTASRAGAGGVIPGQVGLRPHGLKKASDLVDLLTPNKTKPKARVFDEEIGNPSDFAGKDGKKVESPFTLAIILPRDFCPDCDRRNRPEKGGCINTGFWFKDEPSLGVKAMESYISFFCQECLENYRALINDPGADVSIATVTGIRELRQQRAAERLTRVRANTEAFIRAMRTAGRMEIYVDGRTD